VTFVRRPVRLTVACLAAATLVACVKSRDSIPPRLSLGAATCASDVALTNAVAGVKDKDGKYTATMRFTDTAACVTDASGATSVYQVVVLPEVTDGLMATAVSVPFGETIFTPRLQLRDDKGAIAREIGRDAFLFSGPTLQAQLRLRAGDRYLVVLSDPGTVGQTTTQIASRTVHSGVAAGGVYVPVNTGAEGSTNLTFALNGEVTVVIEPIPDANKR
jgi:hypothetical protein